MRTFSVEEQLLMVGDTTLAPLPAEAWPETGQEVAAPPGHEVTMEPAREQIVVVGPPQTTLHKTLETIRTGRAAAERAAARLGGHVVALPVAPGPLGRDSAHRAPRSREESTDGTFAHGFRIRVTVESRIEVSSVLDGIGPWLPTLLALSANSPFWNGLDTGYASYRHQMNLQWPAERPTETYGWTNRHGRHRADVLGTGVPMEAGTERPTLEVRIADVCLEPTDAAVIAALTRALVESTARNWRAQAPEMSASALEGWAWLASRSGVEGQLIDPTNRAAVPASVVVDRLLDFVRPVLSEYGEAESIEAGVADILRRGSGARRQREAYARRHEVRDIVAAAVDFTRFEPAESSGVAPSGVAPSGVAPSGVAPSGEAPADDPYWTAKPDWWKPPNGHEAPLQLHGLNHPGRQ